MTLPHLWYSVSLRSYCSVRYKQKDDTTLPEGFGSASPFGMGLNALVTHNVSALVRNLVLEGDRTAQDLKECSRVGRISEQSMILNIAVRAAIDKCTGLESFKWDLDTKLQPNVYTGLTALKNLRRLWLRFPSSRAPQPTIELPALPNLTSFVFTNYDPLCYPDDVSRLLLHASRLTELQMHFSPRMRAAGEPSVHLPHFFRKNIAAKRKLKLRVVGMYNLFAHSNEGEVLEAIEARAIDEFTSLNTFGRDEDGFGGAESMGTDFLDNTWTREVDGGNTEWGLMKAIRLDHLHKHHTFSKGLERLYLVNARYGNQGTIVNGSPGLTDDSPSASSGSAPTRGSSGSNWQTPTPRSSVSGASTAKKLRDVYFNQICDLAGPTLKHLIFPARWGLNVNQMARLIRSCPNLTQLSCFFDCTKFEMLRMLVPFLTKLVAIRLIVPEQCSTLGEGKAWLSKSDDEEEQERKMRRELANGDFKNLRYVGLGRWIWEIGGLERVSEKVPVEDSGEHDDGRGEVDGQGRSPQYKEEMVWRRKLRKLRLEDVQHVEIWQMDTLDVV